MIDAIGEALRRLVRWAVYGDPTPRPPVDLAKHDRIIRRMQSEIQRRDAITRRYVTGDRKDTP